MRLSKRTATAHPLQLLVLVVLCFFQPEITVADDDFSVVWIPVRSDHPFAEAIKAESSIYLPVFLNAEDLEEFNRSGGANLTPKTLTTGILLGLQDDPPTLDKALLRETAFEVFPLLPEQMGWENKNH